MKRAVAWTPAAMVAAWAFVRILGLDSGYPLVPLVTYTPYVLPIAFIASAVAAALRQWKAAALAGAAFLALAFAIAPRMLGGPTESSDGSIGVMTANVLAGRADVEQLVELARARDVELLAVQELTPGFDARLRGGIGEQLPHAVVEARKGVRGTGIYSANRPRPLEPVHGRFPQARATFGRKRPLEVVSVHPVPPTSGTAVEQWEEGIERLPDAATSADRHLLLGDFNATLDNSALRDLLDRGYDDAAESFGAGLTATWPAIDQPFRYLPVTIDHILYEEAGIVRDYEVLDIDGTDHRAVYAELALK